MATSHIFALLLDKQRYKRCFLFRIIDIFTVKTGTENTGVLLTDTKAGTRLLRIKNHKSNGATCMLFKTNLPSLTSRF